MSAIQRLLISIEVNGRAVGTFRIVRYTGGVRYSGVSVKRGTTVLHPIFGFLNQLTSNFHERRYYGWQNSRWYEIVRRESWLIKGQRTASSLYDSKDAF